MVLVREAKPDDWVEVRDIRLTALSDAPYAFGSSYEREAAFTESDWRRRLLSGGVTFLAHLPDCYGAGIGGGFVAPEGTTELVSMWVSPAARGNGVGRALVDAVTSWARSRGHGELHLWVTESNSHARKLYERGGFIATGERQPLPSDPALQEIRMRRTL